MAVGQCLETSIALVADSRGIADKTNVLSQKSDDPVKDLHDASMRGMLGAQQSSRILGISKQHCIFMRKS